MSERLQLEQVEDSHEVIPQQIAPAIVAQHYRLWHVGLARTQGRSAPGFLSSDHAFVIASRPPSRSAGGQAMQAID
jgi:hypothetical protein